MINDLNEWCNEIYKNITDEKKIILIAGASCSGKSYNSKLLNDYLNKKRIKSTYFSADMYYKGLGRIIVEKAFFKKKFSKYAHLMPFITQTVVNETKHESFDDKLNSEHSKKIFTKFLSKMDSKTSKKLLDALTHEKNNMNYDEPFAIDFNLLSKHVTKLINNKNIIIPNYSFITSERTFEKNFEINPKNFDVFIIEGIYVLRDELLKNINQKVLIKTAIDCDEKTLMARKLYRDTKEAKRTTLSTERTFMSFLTNIMPSFKRYILPTFKKADFIYTSNISKKEISKKQKRLQYKYCTNDTIFELLNFTNLHPTKTEQHKDYFLFTSKGKNDIIFRLREENELATKFSVKVKIDEENYTIDEYNLKNEFSIENRNIKKLLMLFKKNGYESIDVISKTRQHYEYNGIKFKVDKLKTGEVYVEIDSNYQEKISILKKLLRLNKFETNSYFEIQKNNFMISNNECEKKYIISNISEEVFSEHKKKHVRQYYLDLSSKKNVTLLNKTFHNVINFNDIVEARVRIINDCEAFVTLKSDGILMRTEKEKEISIKYAAKLISKSNKFINKTRYEIFKNNDILAEIDFYLDKNLTILEIEFNPSHKEESQIDELAKKLIGPYEIIDVTDDKNNKNKNLAQYK